MDMTEPSPGADPVAVTDLVGLVDVIVVDPCVRSDVDPVALQVDGVPRPAPHLAVVDPSARPTEHDRPSEVVVVVPAGELLVVSRATRDRSRCAGAAHTRPPRSQTTTPCSTIRQ